MGILENNERNKIKILLRSEELYAIIWSEELVQEYVIPNTVRIWQHPQCIKQHFRIVTDVAYSVVVSAIVILETSVTQRDILPWVSNTGSTKIDHPCYAIF